MGYFEHIHMQSSFSINKVGFPNNFSMASKFTKMNTETELN